jgi:prophage regulatory protein
MEKSCGGCGVKDSVKVGELDDTGRRDSLVDLRAVAGRVGVSTRAVYRLVASGELPPPVKVGRASRWFVSDVEGFMEKLRRARTIRLPPGSKRGAP